MKEVFLGEIIKQRRNELGLTQEQLCEGICEPITISRMENGKQVPSYNNIKALLQRLGLPDNRYYALLSKNEIEIEILKEEILSSKICFEKALEDEKENVREFTLGKIHQLESIIDNNDRVTRQYIISIKCFLGDTDGSYNFIEQRNTLLKALQLTVPCFSVENISIRYYSSYELVLISQIAATYSMEGESEKAISIYRQLFYYIQERKQYSIQYTANLSSIAHDYARALKMANYYEEAIEIAELGRKTCIMHGHYQYLPDLLVIMAQCHYFLEETEKSSELYFQAHYLYMAIDDKYNMNIIDNEIKDHINLDFDFTIP